MVADIPDTVERWTAKRRVALVVSILKGETSVADAARKHALTVAEEGGSVTPCSLPQTVLP